MTGESVEAVYFENFDLKSIVTLVDAHKLESLLKQADYCPKKTAYLVNGFRYGFDIGYRGPSNVIREAPNLKLTVGDETILWNKVMKEVKEKKIWWSL